jgi:hypothetical protein
MKIKSKRMKKKTRVRLPALIGALSQVARRKGFMTKLALKIQAKTAAMKPGRLGWYCFAFFLVSGLVQTWLFTNAFGFGKKLQGFSSIRPVVTQGAVSLRSRSLETSFRHEWDSLMADPVMKRSWDGFWRNLNWRRH